MYMLFMETEKGFSCSDGKKIYFPDRSLSMTSMLVEVESIKDRVTYAFVVGKAVAQERIGKVIDYINKGVINMIDVVKVLNYRGIQLYRGGDYNIYAVVDGVLEKVVDANISGYSMEFLYSREYARKIEILSDTFQVRLEDVNDDALVKAFLKDVDSMDVEGSFEGVINTVYKGKELRVLLYNNKVLKVVRSQHGFDLYFIMKEGKLLPLPAVVGEELERRGVLSSRYCKDITDFYLKGAEKYHIRLYSGLGINNKEVLVSYFARCMGQKVELKFISCDNFSYEVYEKHKGEIESSFKEYEEFKARVARNATKKTIGELRNLSYKEWQMGSSPV